MRANQPCRSTTVTRGLGGGDPDGTAEGEHHDDHQEQWRPATEPRTAIEPFGPSFLR
jgi:hypothetical protein